MFFALKPHKSILADSNVRLIETYAQIRENPTYISKLLRRYQVLHNNEYYYLERKRKYPRSASQRAAQFIYLNRTCWNGLYRVNLKGEFNVPLGTKSSVILNTDNFVAIANALKNSELTAQDFSVTMEKAGAGDLVYVDPPYTVKHKDNGFAKYNEEIFNWDDQVRLRNAVVSAIERGALVAVSNAHHPSLLKLYRDIGTHKLINRKSVIAAGSKYR